MKWKDLSLKERKQIYDSVRVNNPGATYFDIKEQFDSIPAYEDGGKSIVDEVNKSNVVQPEAYITPAGYIKDAVNFIEDLGKGDYAGAAFDSGKEYITNTYLNYLANSNNTYSSAELRKMGLFDAAGSRSYLLNPTEAKSHMLTLKRSLKDSGKITNWSTPVDENMILEYMRNPTSNKMVKNQYDLYRNKNEYIDRLNKLIPMEILMPLGGAGFVGHELNKE